MFCFLCLLLYVIALLSCSRNKSGFNFMSFDHSIAYRGVSALIIMLSHAAGRFGVRYFTPLGGIGVAVFLISSGYGLNESYKKKGMEIGYWKPKTVRLFFPYAVVIIALRLYSAIEGSEFDFPYYWFIDYILVWYAAFYIIAILPGLYARRYSALGIIGLVFFLLGGGLRAEQAISFLLGVWISDNTKRAEKVLTSKIMILCMAMVGAALLALKQVPIIRSYEDTHLWYALQISMKLPFALALIGITQKIQSLVNNSLISAIGIASYEFYLVHYRLLDLLRNGVVGMVWFLALSLILSIALNKLTRKIQLKRFQL